MKFEHSTVEKYLFRFGSDDTITLNGVTYQLGGGHAVFMLDTESWILSIECDWGNYCYRWCASSHETFKQLLCRLSSDYLLRKLSSQSEINWKKTKKRARELYFQYGGDPDKDRERVKEFLNEVDRVDENEIRFYDFMMEYNPNLWEAGFFVKEFPLQAQLAVEIFMNYLVAELKKEAEEAA